MNMFSTRLSSEQELEERSIIQQYGMNTIMGEIHEAHHTLPHSFSTLMTTRNDPSYDDLIEMKPSNILESTYISPKLQPPTSFHLPPNSKPHFHHPPSSRILSFENATQNVMDHEHSPTYLNSIFIHKVEAEGPPNWMKEKGTKRAQPLHKSQSSAQHHIIACTEG